MWRGSSIQLIAFGAACTAACTWSGELRAQASAGAELEEIIVTAQKREESALKVGMSIKALSADTLASLRVQSTADLAKLVPGFTVAPSSGNVPIYTIRGVGFQTPNMTSTSPVGVYVDEVAYAYPFMSKGVTFDIERVEVLKGPQGTLYGRNTTGGLVNYIEAKPTDTFDGALTAGYGSYQDATLQGFVSGPLASTLNGRFAFDAERSYEGWQRSVTRDERLGRKEKLGLRTVLEWQPADAFKSSLSVNYWRDRSDTQAPQAVYYTPDFGLITPVGPPPNAPVFPIDPLVNASGVNQAPLALASLVRTNDARLADWAPANYPGATQRSESRSLPRADARFYGLGLRSAYAIDDRLSLISVTGYNDVRRGDFTDSAGLQVESLAFKNDGRIKSFSQELRLNGDYDRFNWIAGVNYSHDDLSENQINYVYDGTPTNQLRQLALNFYALGSVLGFNDAIVPGLSAFAPYTLPQIANGFTAFQNVLEETNRTYGLFLNGGYHLSETVKLNAGVRYTNDKLSFRGCSSDYNGNSNPVLVPALSVIFVGRPLTNTANGCTTLQNAPPGSPQGGLAGVVSSETSKSNVAGRVNVEYSPSDTTLLYASISRGFKSAAYPVIPANVRSQLDPIRQEEVTAYEIGAKARLFGNTLELSVAPYYYDYVDKQLYSRISDPIFNTLPAIVNVPKSALYGAEAELTWRVARDLTARVSGNYLHTEVKDYQGYAGSFSPITDAQARSNVTFSVIDFSGKEFTYAPRWTGSAYLLYSHPMGGALVFSGVLDASYQSSTTGDLSNNPLFKIAGYTLVNASLGIGAADEKWSANVWVRNATDKFYVTATEYGIDDIFRYTGMPRTYGVSVTTKF